ncbi:TadE/TadG family type IV pilus assembly protein (plasmid) [Coraliomargarita sp. W4R53]
MRPLKPSTEVVCAGDTEAGSAALEFIMVGLLMLVPLVYLIITLGVIQGQSLGTEAGARHIARTVATSTDIGEARERADVVLASIADSYGIDPGNLSLSLECRPATAECPSAGATVIVTLQTAVALPLVPPVLGLDALASVPIQASSAQKVSRFWGVSP